MKIRVPLKPPNCCFDVFHCGMGQVSLRLLICSICVHQINSSSSRRGGGRLSRQEQIFRPLVPQMLPNYTAPVLPPASEVSLRFKIELHFGLFKRPTISWLWGVLYDGCRILQLQIRLWLCSETGVIKSMEANIQKVCKQRSAQYREACATLVEGSTTSCSTACQHALVGLISTEEGERLMACSCQSQDCALEKRRVEPCRDKVTVPVFQVPNYRSSFFATGDLAHSTWHSGALLGSNCDLPGEPWVRDCSALLQHQLQRALQRRRVHGSLQELSKDPRKAESSSKVGHLHLWRFEIELRFYKGKRKLVVLWQRQHCDEEEKTEWRKRSPNARSLACRKRFLSENSTFQVLLN